MQQELQYLGERRIALLTPKVGWEVDEFVSYWLEQHGPLVAGTPDYGMYRQTYAQDHVRRDLELGDVFPFAGMASVLMPLESAPNFAATEVFKTRVLPDEEHFLDRGASLAWRAECYEQVRGEGPLKAIAFGAFEGGVDADGAVSHGLEVMSRVIAEGASPRRAVTNIILAPATDLGGDPVPTAPRVDWVQEAWFDTEVDVATWLRRLGEQRQVSVRWAILADEHVLFAAGKPLV